MDVIIQVKLIHVDSSVANFTPSTAKTFGQLIQSN